MHARERAVLGLYVLLALLAVPVFPHFLSPNEFTRWAFVASLVEDGTPEISRVLPLLGPSFEDVSGKDGRVYSNKAPGAALVSLPGYFLARTFAGPPSAASMRPVLWAMRLFGATLPAALLALLVYRSGVLFGAPPARALLAMFALLFATPLFAYGLLLFSHALVAACLFGAWVALFLPRDSTSHAFRRDVAAGALLGLAVLAEYPAAVPGAVLFLCVAVPAPRRALAMVAGGAPFAAALFVYDFLCFGGVFELSSAHERAAGFRSLASAGVFGIGVPSPEVFLRLLADPSKGLLVFSPFLLLWPAAFRALRASLAGPARLALVLAPLSLLLLYAGYPNWHGGFTVGPRYLVAVLPFLVFPFAFRDPGLRGSQIEAVLIGASTLAVCATTLAFPFVPPGFALPWATFAGFFFEKGLTLPNVLQIGAPGVARFVLPVIVCVASYFFLEGKREKGDAWRGTALAFCFGAAACAALGLSISKQISPLPPALLLQRAYIADVYFEQRGALEDEIARTGTPQPRLLARRERELALPPPSLTPPRPRV
ncbi:MAG: hypothetical protein PT977_05205 [Acidobacteriota bacterium]|nr:hypothetical protein [Acidobacteriota bacterium]